MINPSLEECVQNSSKKYITLYTKIIADTLTPVLVYQKLRSFSNPSYLLESVEQNEKLGRFSLIGINPQTTFRSNGHQISIETKGKGGVEERVGNPIDALFQMVEEFSISEVSEILPHQGGMVGYFGYDSIRYIEEIPNQNPNDLDLPESFFILPKNMVVFDHLYQTITITSLTETGDAAAYQKSCEEIENIINCIVAPVPKNKLLYPQEIQEPKGYTSNMSKEEYLKIVERAKQNIVDGDIFQVVLSQRFSTDYQGDPFEVYRALRRINPSPYLFYLDYEDFQIAGSSPEVLVKRDEQKLTLRPIAGTRPRGKTPEEDLALEEDLLSDEKEIAEHIMLVDLGRNDLGRVSEFGSVKPTKFKYIENYSHVKHIVSNLEGQLRTDKNNADLIKATFPAGTLSGAPKVRAMEIIDELEVSRRGFYGGTVVSVNFNGNMDACIGIRSVVIKDEKAHVQAGAGVVADSVPENEHQECLNKAKAVLSAIQSTKGVME